MDLLLDDFGGKSFFIEIANYSSQGAGMVEGGWMICVNYNKREEGYFAL
jgi:hypothetical protein